MFPLITVFFLVGFLAENPADLAQQVASTDSGVREEALGMLEEMDRAALPALRIAVGKASEPGHAQRLADLIDLIERKRLLRATKVEIDDQQTTISDAVADLGRRARFHLVLDPPQDTGWLNRKLTFQTKEPIPFWEAVDRLGVAGDFRLDAASAWASFRSEPSARLIRGTAPLAPTNYVGPYRLELVSLNRHRQVTQARPGVKPNVQDEFSATVEVAAEPGIAIERNGSPRVIEVRDDKGANLLPATTFDPASRNVYPFRLWRNDSLSTISYKIPLGIPAARGGTLKHLRGVLPINAVVRTGPMMSFPLEGSEGRPQQTGGLSLVVTKLDRVGGVVRTIHVEARGERAKLTGGTAPGPRELTVGPLAPGFHPDDHIQVLDTLGRPFQINSNIPPARADGTYIFQINIHTFPPLTTPTTLRYYGLVGEAIEIPFDFTEVPMP